MAEIIKHRGIVEKIDGSHVVVRIVQTSACSACSAKGLCNASESKEKQIDVYEVNPSYRIGEEVVLCGSTSMGMRAVFLAFGIPVFILLAALFVTMRVTDGDALFSAVVALLAVVPYYLVIYLMKNKLNKTFSFVIEKQ
ncbi:MAG: SoxR reducing system RseC family protein [Bacteroides sp.]|nr:SoxR reducing system RseC family protein [Bacteroides sp.]MBQ8875299.1 SoxR reducing system RseC family protein [Bacteroides sp.]